MQDRADSDIIVRAPVRADIQANGWPYEETPDADYAFRARVKREVWADFVADAAMAVDYDNYKNTVPEDDDARHEAYMESDGAAGAPAARLGQVSPRVAWVVAHIDLPEQTERLPKPIQEKTRVRLDDALPHDTLPQLRDRALIIFLLSTGCRISEALTLDRSDWQREQVVVMGKRRKERVVIISPKARAAVDEYLALRTDPSPALFIGFQRGMVGGVENRLTPGGAGYVCDQVARRLGLERWHPHQLRHTFGTAVEEELGDPRLTAELLRHSGLGSVSGYTKISRRRREEAAAALAVGRQNGIRIRDGA